MKIRIFVLCVCLGMVEGIDDKNEYDLYEHSYSLEDEDDEDFPLLNDEVLYEDVDDEVIES